MLRTLLAAALSLALALPSFARSKDDVVTVSADPVVFLDIKGVGDCTGFVAQSGFGDLIVTAGHCLADALENHAEIDAKDSIGRSYPVAPVYFDALHDIAIFRGPSDRPASDKLMLACRAPVNIGDTVSMTGYPLDFGKVTVTGKIAGLPITWGPWPDVYRVAMFAGPGNSGSPVMNDKGEVIGVLVGGNPQWPGMSMVVPIGVVCQPGIA
jgi:S1-C subfamily serine protease